MFDTRAYKVTVQEVVNLQNGFAFQILVGHLQMHLVGLFVGLGARLLFQLFLFFLQSDFAYIPY